MNCIFCKIINKEIPAKVIYEDNNFLVFLDISPVSKGHALVVPKKHAADFSSLPDKEAGKFARLVHNIAPQLVSTLGADGYNLGLNNGPAAGQIIGHVHWHIIPRYVGDDLHLWGANSEAKELLEETFNKLQGKIK